MHWYPSVSPHRNLLSGTACNKCRCEQHIKRKSLHLNLCFEINLNVIVDVVVMFHLLLNYAFETISTVKSAENFMISFKYWSSCLKRKRINPFRLNSRNLNLKWIVHKLNATDKNLVGRLTNIIFGCNISETCMVAWNEDFSLNLI